MKKNGREWEDAYIYSTLSSRAKWSEHSKRLGPYTSSTITLSTGTPQGYVLSPILFSLFTHNSVSASDTNTIVKFADDTTLVGLITDN